MVGLQSVFVAGRYIHKTKSKVSQIILLFLVRCSDVFYFIKINVDYSLLNFFTTF